VINHCEEATAMNDDWRLNGQEEYLTGATIIRRRYEAKTANPDSVHDHCEFCGEKFMITGEEDSLEVGYTTQDEYRWICDSCFADFHENFSWTVMPSGGI
jgi:hypothetical protein